jgi:hypothetical protein
MSDSIARDSQASDQKIADTAHKDACGLSDSAIIEMYAPLEPKPEKRFFHDWGLQCWADWIIGSAAIKRLRFLVPHTLVPIIKLCAEDREVVEATYRKVIALNETSRFFDSPREKHRINYGNYVRAIEWCCFELRKYFTKRAYEDLVINSSADFVNNILGSVISKMQESMIKWKRMGNKKPSRMTELNNKIMNKYTAWFFENVLNISGWLGGPIKMGEVRLQDGLMVMEVLDCLMLRAPRMKNLPEEACLLACKGGCEKVFAKGPARMTFDARLPETTCEIKLFME